MAELNPGETKRSWLNLNLGKRHFENFDIFKEK